MKAYCDFTSEVFEKAIYDIQGDDFKFTNRYCLWKCRLDELGRLIEIIETAFDLPTGHNTPPIKIHGHNRIITITEDKNHLCVREELMTKFLEELKGVYEVYG